jgi:tryptophan 2,3-dioxygenase
VSEHFFIVCHQVTELWLAQVLANLSAAAEILRAGGAGGLHAAARLLARAAGEVRLLAEQLGVFGYLSAGQFAAFRPLLGTASGAQSRQFTLLEEFTAADGAGSGGLEELLDAVVPGGLGAVHLDGTCPEPGCRCAWEMVALSAGLAAWRSAHVSLVRRLLGEDPGTGGTAGAAYLEGRSRVAFPRIASAVREPGQTSLPELPGAVPELLSATGRRWPGTCARECSSPVSPRCPLPAVPGRGPSGTHTAPCGRDHTRRREIPPGPGILPAAASSPQLEIGHGALLVSTRRDEARHCACACSMRYSWCSSATWRSCAAMTRATAGMSGGPGGTGRTAGRAAAACEAVAGNPAVSPGASPFASRGH